MALKRRQRQSVNSALARELIECRMTERFTPIVSRITRWNSVCRAGEGEEEREGERNGRNGSIRFSPRPLSSDPRAPRDPVRGDPFRRRFARNSVSPRQSSSIGLNGAIGIARSLPGNGVSFRSVPFRFVTTKARYRVSNLDVSTRVRRCSPTLD